MSNPGFRARDSTDLPIDTNLLAKENDTYAFTGTSVTPRIHDAEGLGGEMICPPSPAGRRADSRPANHDNETNGIHGPGKGKVVEATPVLI
jgi:hypothetical protein